MQGQMDSFGQANAGDDAELGEAPSQVSYVTCLHVYANPHLYTFLLGPLALCHVLSGEFPQLRVRWCVAWVGQGSRGCVPYSLLPLLVEVDDEDQADELLAPVAQRMIARTPHVVRLCGCSTSAPPSPY